jgi:transmembrane sensor
MKYNNYDIEDFLADEDFIRWVKNKGGGRAFFFESWLKTNPVNKEKALTARELLQLIKSEQLQPTQAEFDQVFASLLKYQNEQQPITVTSTRNTINIWWRWAAIILFVFSFSFVINEFLEKPPVEIVQTIQYIKKSNPPGQRSQIHLPDGSKVYLNSESSLVYAENFGTANREIRLQGEAYFEVKKNDSLPFIVQTGIISTKVLGTSFNVNARDNANVSVVLIEGQVEIRQTETQFWQEFILKSGEKVIANDQEIKTSQYHYRDIAWKEGVLIFEDASLAEVKNTLEQWYGISISIENRPGGKWNYSGKFKNTSLEVILERMSFTERFTYEINNDLVTLKF